MNRLADLAKTASQHDCEQMLNELDSFRNTAAISDGAQQRILSSVMKKAGFEMDNAISITEGRQNRQNRTHTEKPEQVSVVRRGRHVLAACIAFAVIAATAGAVIFGGKINIEPRKPQPRSVSDVLPEEAAPEGQAAVPDITGLNEEEAKRALEDAGFVPVKIEVYDNDQKPGDVA
ncbi:MAG: PASTA domain-containing protein, partial [Oscillospiraceae bacterium]|nr:PASTA domain-containing protein [Oscillospiraceae bacterium]